MTAGVTLNERFWSKVNKTESCWLWRGSGKRTVPGGGHGEFKYQGKTTLAHRLSWAAVNGDIPGGACVLHRCNVPRCVNPAHLYLGTHMDNAADQRRAGTAARPSLRITACHRGHDFTPANTLVQFKGGYHRRMCRTCHRERELARRHREQGPGYVPKPQTRLSPADRAKVAQLSRTMERAQIAALFGCSIRSVYRVLADGRPGGQD